MRLLGTLFFVILFLVGCKGQNQDAGVTICYNSVATTDAICPVLSPSAVCINPLNWTTTTAQAPLKELDFYRANLAANVAARIRAFGL